ncbi:MAG: GNAT family N-acetyltransferase [bacterium]|nr:GNAT family N-acetyltransferase [bacterium]
MRITCLDMAKRALVLDLDPLMMLDRLEFPASMALLATETDEMTQDALPVGLLIASMQDAQMTIDWLYVVPEKRMQGIGEQLLIEAYHFAARKGAVRLCAYFNEEYGRNQICADEKTYFFEHLFLKEQVLGGEWMTDIKTLEMQMNRCANEVSEADCVSFRTLSVSQASAAIVTLQEQEACEMLYPMDAQTRYYDPDLSVLLTDGTQVKGGLLIQCVERITPQIKANKIIRAKENVFYPVLCCAWNEQDAWKLMSASLKRAVAKYSYSTEVRVILKSNRYAAVLDRVLPGQRVNNSLLTAQIADYYGAKEKDERELGMRRLLQLG